MPKPLYAPNAHADHDPVAVLDRLRRDGWDPVPITDPPGYVYPPHTHAETKLLAILSGSIEVRVAGDLYQCQAGDLMIIPGGVEHAALVGPDGCTFYWSEQLR